MPTISAEITPKLIKDNKLEVSCSYNNDAANEAQNQKALQSFESEVGLPPLSTPLAVNNLIFTNGNHLIGEGQAIIIPMGACFTLDLAFLSTLGYRVAISLPATGEVISENALFWTTPELATADYQQCSIGTWDDGSVL